MARVSADDVKRISKIVDGLGGWKAFLARSGKDSELVRVTVGMTGCGDCHLEMSFMDLQSAFLLLEDAYKHLLENQEDQDAIL